MESNQLISRAALKRLPQYLRIIKGHNELEFISSTFIAKELNLNPILVRKDLALVCKSEGKPGNGFEVEKIIQEIEDFLGLNQTNNAIIVGAGKLGQALLNYQGFSSNLNIEMAFDVDETKCDNKRIFKFEKMKSLIEEKDIEIGIITVPKEDAQNVCDKMIDAGIKAIWNFAPINLKVPEKISLKNEDLSTSLLILLKEFNNKNK